MLSTFLSFVVLLVGLMLIHKWSPLFGSVLCSAFAFYGIRRLLQHKLNLILTRLCQNVKCGSQGSTFICNWTSNVGSLLHRALHRRRELVSTLPVDEQATSGSYQDERCDRRCNPGSAHIAEVKTFVENIRVRYIQSWYGLVSSNEDFPWELEFIIEDVLLAICERLSSLDPCKLTEQTITLFHGHYRNYVNALMKVEHARQSGAVGSSVNCLQQDIMQHFAGDHWALKDEIHEQCYMQSVTSVLLGLVQPPNILTSPATNALVIDILTNNIIATVVDLLSDPNWLNGAVVYLCCCENDPDILSFSRSAPHELEAGSLTVYGPPEQQACGATDFTAPTPESESSPTLNVTSKNLQVTQPEACNLTIPSDSSTSAVEQHSTLPKVYFSAQENAAQLLPYNDIEQAVEAELFLGSLTFSDIHITRTESRTVPGKGVHTVYCIEYETSKTEEGHRVICKVHETWRRFREFLDLQSNLEKNPALDKHLKGIRGPSRWLGSRLSDKKNVMERRVFLERYLRDLCSRNTIANSDEFRKFLDFGVDSDDSSLPKTTISSARIDKLAQGVKDALDLFRRLPLDDHGINLLSPSENSLLLLAESLPSEVDFIFSDKQILPLQQTVFNFLDNFDQASSPEFSPPQTPSCLPSTRDASPSSPSLQSHTGSGNPPPNFISTFAARAPDMAEHVCSSEALSDLIGSLSSDIPLSSATINLALDAVSGLEVFNSARLVLLFEFLIGKAFEKWLTERMHTALGYSRGVTYVHRLHEKLWGKGASQITFNKEQAKQAIEKTVPFGLHLLLGAKNVTKSADLVVESLQVKRLNRCLVYQLLDKYVDLLMYQEQCDLNSDEEV
ncbi:uncharacterized protein LOC135385725 [Ornithodoros turicata]|uniref:uncharacterized protein LOC135385725 n=1 Tax=Ornithodoros turicata TaxID=34597 RepID=UPI0031389A1C